ncbi:hypothetical protein [Amycolatopsis sp. cg9]|uniref:hypothetical protein n=1 Tax=Amycolatopsis sp. cg9 TaxID=3238801 RepID=UPI0035255B96
MSTATLELRAVVAFVLEHAEENDLDAITKATKSRRGVLREKVAAEVTEQAKVTLVDLSPQYLNGLTGVVTTITSGGRGQRRATVTLDKGSTNTLAFSSEKFGHLAGRDSYDLPGVPLSSCKVTHS